MAVVGRPALASRLAWGACRVRLGSHRLGLIVLLAVLATVPLLVSPVGEFPVDDDWAYAQAVRHLLATGTYERSIWIDTAFVAQAWWGVLVSSVLGFSHTSLRLGTLLLAAGALLAVPRDSGVESRFLDMHLASDPMSLLGVALTETAASAVLLGLAAVPAAPLILSRPGIGAWARWQRLLYDRYLLPVLPGVLALTAYAVRERRAPVPLFLIGAVLFAGWSVGWEREYLVRQSATWTVAEALVADGVPPGEIDAGYEWAGWTRGDAVIEQARAAVLQAGEPRQFVQLVVDGLYRPSSWYVGFGPLGRGCAGQPRVEVSYGDGFVAYGLRRCRSQPVLRS